MVRMIVLTGLLALSACIVGDDDENPPPTMSGGTTSEAPVDPTSPSSTTAAPLSVCEMFEACTSACAEIDVGAQTQTVRRDCLALCPQPDFGMNAASLTQWGETCAGLFPPEGGSSSGEGSSGDTSTGTVDTGTDGDTTGGARLQRSLDSVVGHVPSEDEPTCAEWTLACMAFEDAAQG